jgi:hypothetical protein
VNWDILLKSCGGPGEQISLSILHELSFAGPEFIEQEFRHGMLDCLLSVLQSTNMGNRVIIAGILKNVLLTGNVDQTRFVLKHAVILELFKFVDAFSHELSEAILIAIIFALDNQVERIEIREFWSDLGVVEILEAMYRESEFSERVEIVLTLLGYESAN